MRFLSLFVVLILFIHPSFFFVWAQDEEELVPMEFEDAPIPILIEFVSRQTNKRFIYDRTIAGFNINLKSPNPVKKKDIYRMFESVMEFNNFVLINSREGDHSEVIKIIPKDKLKSHSPTLVRIEDLDFFKVEDKYITLVYPLKYISASEVQQALASTVSSDAPMVAMSESNTLLISDFAPNVKKTVEIIRLMDIKPEEPETEIIPLEYAGADDTVPKLEELLSDTDSQTGGGRRAAPPPGGRGGGGTEITTSASPYGANRSAVKLVPEERTNSIIVKAFPERITEVRNLIRRLDQKQNFDTGIKVYELKHSDAEQLQEVISELVGAAGTFAPSSPSGANPTANSSRRTGSSDSDRPTIVAETQTNSLLYTGSKIQRDSIEELIKKLDVRRPQVLIEAAFIEITPTNVFNLGVELALLDNPKDGSTRGLGGTLFGLSSLVDSAGVPITPQSPGIPAGRIPLPNDGVSFALSRGNAFTLPLIIQTLESTSNTRILSTPRVLTNDNQQAEIKVSDAVPVVQFQTTNAGTDNTSFQEFQEAGTELKITPHIAAEDYLRLDIEQIIEKFDFTVAAVASAPPPKTTRSLATSITVPNGHPIIIGGLLGNDYQHRVDKIPFLGDIPLIGYLFRNTVRTQTKTNVYLFLTAHILRDEDFRDLNRISYRDKEILNKEHDIKNLDEYLDRYKKKNMKIDPDEGDNLYILEYMSPTEE
jgi:general secretion pathway protein D